MYSDIAFFGELQSPHKSIVVGKTMTTKFGQPSFLNNNGFGEFLGIGCPHKSIVETTTIVEQNLGNQALHCFPQ
jgi:hypothetical protein